MFWTDFLIRDIGWHGHGALVEDREEVAGEGTADFHHPTSHGGLTTQQEEKKRKEKKDRRLARGGVIVHSSIHSSLVHSSRPKYACPPHVRDNT